MNIVDVCAVVFATGAVIEVWHKGSLFADQRAKLQALQDTIDPETLKGRAIELLLCPFCQSYHVPFYLLAGILLGDWCGATIGAVARLMVYGLAATRLSNLLDGFLPPQMRYAPPEGTANYGSAAGTGNPDGTPPV